MPLGCVLWQQVCHPYICLISLKSLNSDSFFCSPLSIHENRGKIDTPQFFTVTVLNAVWPRPELKSSTTKKLLQRDFLCYIQTTCSLPVLGRHGSASLCRDRKQNGGYNANISVQTPLVHLVAKCTHPKTVRSVLWRCPNTTVALRLLANVVRVTKSFYWLSKSLSIALWTLLKHFYTESQLPCSLVLNQP